MARHNVYFYCPSGPPPLWWGENGGHVWEQGSGLDVRDIGPREWAPRMWGMRGIQAAVPAAPKPRVQTRGQPGCQRQALSRAWRPSLYPDDQPQT